MPSYIVRLEDKDGTPLYMEWSTVVDAPVTYLMPLQEFRAAYQEKYGRYGRAGGADDLESRLARVADYGTSAMGYRNADEVLAGNRAGPGESTLTRDEILEEYRFPR